MLQQSLPKRPRHYAQDIIALRTREERVAALAAVPVELQDLTRKHVENHFAKKAAQRRLLRAGQ